MKDLHFGKENHVKGTLNLHLNVTNKIQNF